MASSKSSATIEVLINGVISNEARVHDIKQVSGASVNTAVFEVVAPSTNIMETENNNLAGIAGQNQRVEIKIYDQNAQPHTVFLGRVTGATISIGPQGEVIKFAGGEHRAGKPRAAPAPGRARSPACPSGSHPGCSASQAPPRRCAPTA